MSYKAKKPASLFVSGLYITKTVIQQYVHSRIINKVSYCFHRQKSINPSCGVISTGIAFPFLDFLDCHQEDKDNWP